MFDIFIQFEAGSSLKRVTRQTDNRAANPGCELPQGSTMLPCLVWQNLSCTERTGDTE